MISVSTGVAIAATLAVATATAVAHDQRPLGPHTTIGVHGAGPVKIGMTIRQAEAASGRDLEPRGDGRPGSVCWHARVRAVRGLSFMFSGHRIVRVSSDYPGGRNPTTRGIRRGDSESAVKRAYRGRIKVEPHLYDRSGHYLIYTPAARALRDRRIYFETDGKRVTGIRAGQLPAVAYVEGCS